MDNHLAEMCLILKLAFSISSSKCTNYSSIGFRLQLLYLGHFSWLKYIVIYYCYYFFFFSHNLWFVFACLVLNVASLVSTLSKHVTCQGWFCRLLKIKAKVSPFPFLNCSEILGSCRVAQYIFPCECKTSYIIYAKIFTSVCPGYVVEIYQSHFYLECCNLPMASPNVISLFRKKNSVKPCRGIFCILFLKRGCC